MSNVETLVPDSQQESAKPVFQVMPASPERNRRLAYLMLKEGKAFQPAALEAGFPPSIAKQGLRYARTEYPGLNEAFELESRSALRPDELLAKCVNALIQDIDKHRSSGIERTVETLGKLKIHDWFVRNTEMQMGILIGVAEAAPDDTAQTLEEYKE